jgi:hypothetical protein
MLKTEATLKDRIIPLKYSQERLKLEIEMIRKSKPPSRITSLLMRRKKSLILKSIVLETHPLFPI